MFKVVVHNSLKVVAPGGAPGGLVAEEATAACTDTSGLVWIGISVAAAATKAASGSTGNAAASVG